MVGVCTVCSGRGEVCLLSAERGAGGRRWHTPNTPIRTFPASAPCLGRERAGRVPGAGGGGGGVKTPLLAEGRVF